MRGGESTRVLVEVPEPVLADGVSSDQALMSSKMSSTVIVSDLRLEVVELGLWGAEGATGEGRMRGEGSEGWSDARRIRCGGRVMLCGNVGSSCGFGTEVGGIVGRGLLASRGIGRTESGRARPFEESR